MKKKSKKDMANDINKKRAEMLEEAKRYGMTSKEVLNRSEELDSLIYEFMQKNN